MMRFRALMSVSLTALVWGGVGCSRADKTQTAPAPTNANVRTEKQAAAPVTETPHGSRRKALSGAPVFVDGKMAAMLRYGELPPTLGAHSVKPGAPARHYRLSEYLTAIGVDVARVKSIHVRGNGHRISSIEGSELAADRARFVFDFLGTDTGAARVAWDTTGLRNTFRAHEIRDVLVYVDKAVPQIDDKRSCYLDPAPSRACSASVPHAEGEMAKGTRVYLDGKLVGHVKRRRLDENVTAGKTVDGETQFALDKFLSSIGAAVKPNATVELLNGDDVIARASGAQLAAMAREATFVLPRHQSGRVVLSIPSSWQAAGSVAASAQVTAIQVHERSAPLARALAPIDSDVPPSDETAAREEG